MNDDDSGTVSTLPAPPEDDGVSHNCVWCDRLAANGCRPAKCTHTDHSTAASVRVAQARWEREWNERVALEAVEVAS